MLKGLKGHQLSGTRRLNGHYQSGRRGAKWSYDYILRVLTPTMSWIAIFINPTIYNPYRDKFRVTINPSIPAISYPAYYAYNDYPYINISKYTWNSNTGYAIENDNLNVQYPNDSLTLRGGSGNISAGIPANINVTSEFTVTQNNGRIWTISSGDINANFDCAPGQFWVKLCMEFDPADVPTVILPSVDDYPPVYVKFEVL